MKISDYAAWLEEDREDRDRIAATYPQYLQGHIEAQQERDQKRLQRLQQFPYSVVLEGLYDEHDYAACWCWQRFGPQNGPCADHHSTYPACPLVLETEYIERTVYRGAERFHKRYREPAEHEHFTTYIAYCTYLRFQSAWRAADAETRCDRLVKVCVDPCLRDILRRVARR